MVSRFCENEGISLYTQMIVNEILKNSKIKLDILCFKNLKKECLEKFKKLKIFPILTSNPLSIIKILPYVKSYDVIHIQMEPRMFGKYIFGFQFIPILLYLKLLKKKIILTHHSVYDEKEIREYIENEIFKKSLIGKVIALLYPEYVKMSMKLLSLLADKNITLSLTEYKNLRKIAKSEKIIYIPHGFKPSKIKNKKLKKKINLLLFGFIRPEKGYELAIESMKYLPNNFRLIIAGSIQLYNPRAKNYFKFLIEKVKEVKKLGKDIILINKFFNEKEKEKIINNSDIILIPYKIIAVSGVMNDAINFAKPVVATVLKEDIEKFGIGKFSNRNPIEFANKIIEISKNYEKYRERLIRIRKNFFISKITKEIIKLYFSL